MSSSRQPDPASAIAAAKISTLHAKLARARQKSDAMREAAGEAKAEFKRVRKAYKQAKRAAKDARKKTKALKRQLAKAKLTASLLSASRARRAGVAKTGAGESPMLIPIGGAKPRPRKTRKKSPVAAAMSAAIEATPLSTPVPASDGDGGAATTAPGIPVLPAPDSCADEPRGVQ